MKIISENLRTLYFDYDGTIHNSIKIYGPAFRKAYAYLEAQGHAEEREWHDDEISRWLGFNKDEMWETFMPELPAELKQKAGSMIGEEMKELITAGKAELYEEALEVLSYLKLQGYRLVFISNCSNHYMETMKEMFSLDNYFDKFYTSESFGYKPKYEILKQVLDDHPKDAVIIGDRYIDMEAGYKNRIPAIGCSYGYGTSEELENSTLVIDDIRVLIGVL